jgi:hypothetical protein
VWSQSRIIREKRDEEKEGKRMKEREKVKKVNEGTGAAGWA